MIFFVYILRCADESLYAGATNNLVRRLREHSELKSGAHYTKIRRPVTLVHVEKYATLAKARKREAEIKRMTREQKEKIIPKDSPVQI